MSDLENRYTSASRLIIEATRARDLFAPREGRLYSVLEEWLGDEDRVHWSRGLLALRRAIDVAEDDLAVLTEARREKYREAIQAFREITEPSAFNRTTNTIAANILTPTVIDRFDSLDEHLIQAGRQISIDSENIAFIDGEIQTILLEIHEWPEGPLKSILVSQLSELRFVIGRYSLFGPDGAQHAVEMLVGTLSVFGATNALGKDSEHTVRRVFAVAKGVMDVLVYVHTGTQALSWSGNTVAALLTGKA